MNMDRMEEYLRNRGFEANKRYDKLSKAYRFEIAKDDFHLVKYFEYPHSKDYMAIDRIQRDFLESMIREFEEDRSKYHKYNEYCRNDIASIHSMTLTPCPTCGHIPGVTCDGTFDVDSVRVECCGIRITGSHYLGAIRSWNEYMKNRNDIMNGDPFKIGSYGIEKEVDIMKKGTYGKALYIRLPEIKNVIFNGPATIVFWSDGTKTVVKAQDGEIVDYEKGLALAISKRSLGNKGNYYNTFTKWLKEGLENG